MKKLCLLIPALLLTGCDLFGPKLEGDGTAESPYIVSKAEDFENLESFLKDKENYFVKLDNDIDVYAFNIFKGEFKGTFDGNNHTITCHRYAEPDEDFNEERGLGLFRKATNSNFLNFKVVFDIDSMHFNVEGSNKLKKYRAGVVGVASNCNFTNIITSGSIKQQDSFFGGETSVGGIVGCYYFNEGNTNSFTKCINNCNLNILNINTNIGGLIGNIIFPNTAYKENFGSLTFSECKNKGSLTGPSSQILDAGKSVYVGGIIGYSNITKKNFDNIVHFEACEITGKLKGKVTNNYCAHYVLDYDD